MVIERIFLPEEEIRQFCERWGITEFAVFGSALRDDFSPESDLDVLVTFERDADWGLLDHVAMQLELQEISQREVDVVTRRAMERSHNWVRREEILSTAQVIYSRGEARHAV